MRVLGLIPARGGSKGVPRKNIRLLCGKPLLQYTAEIALQSQRLSRVIVSTDDEEIAKIGINCGLEVPFIRPPELAQDDSHMLPVIQHALQCLEGSGDYFDAVCLLQPTNPLRRTSDVDACIDLLSKGDLTAVITILNVPTEYNPHWVYFQDDLGQLKLSTGEPNPITRRQDLPRAFHREGSVYVVKRNIVVNQNSLYGDRLAGHCIDSDRTINIDTQNDWERAETLILISKK